MASSWDSILLLVLFVSAIFRSLGYDSPEAAQEALNLKENAEGSGADLSKAEWVVNSPKYFERHHHYELSGPKGRLVDMRGNKTNMGAMTKMLEERLLRTDGFTDEKWWTPWSISFGASLGAWLWNSGPSMAATIRGHDQRL